MTDSDTPPLSLGRLTTLRFCALLSYSMTYIAIPALLYKGTKSPVAAGLALVAEGLIRALLSLLVRRLTWSIRSGRP